jgi:hypothetical protein
MTRQVFSHFHKKGITYKNSDMKDAEQSAHAFWMTTWNDTAELRPRYGRLPNQEVVDVTDCEKIRNIACPKWNLENYKDLIQVFLFQVLKLLMLRGQKEVSAFVLYFSILLLSN